MSLYEALGITRGASEEEIRKAYLYAARATHPDKNQTAEASSRYQGDSPFQKIQRAWEILGDESKRQSYDAQLALIEDAALVVQDSLSLDELDFSAAPEGSGLQSWSYQCRCGDSTDLEEKELSLFKPLFTSIVLPCRSCSLCLEVRI